MHTVIHSHKSNTTDITNTLRKMKPSVIIQAANHETLQAHKKVINKRKALQRI